MEHALLLKELWYALGGQTLQETSENSQGFEAHTGACTEDETLEDFYSQS